MSDVKISDFAILGFGDLCNGLQQKNNPGISNSSITHSSYLLTRSSGLQTGYSFQFARQPAPKRNQ